MAKKRTETLLAARRGTDTTWHGTAFVVEALVLLAFLAFALAVFMQLFGAAHVRGAEERQLTQAVLLASNAAEEFAATPQAGSTSTAFDDAGNELAQAAGAEGVTQSAVSALVRGTGAGLLEAQALLAAVTDDGRGRRVLR